MATAEFMTPARAGLRPEPRDSAAAASPAPRTGMANEAAILARATTDPAAFAPLYEHYVDSIHGFCQLRVNDPDLAADLTSQIFIKALAALPRYQRQANQTSFRSWLFTIARNLVIDHHRTRHPHHSLSDPARPVEVHDPAPSPEDLALTADLRQAIHGALATLTEGQRQIVELRLAGLTGPEIASVLGLRIEAVKSLQFRAYTRLRTLLREEFITAFPGETSSCA